MAPTSRLSRVVKEHVAEILRHEISDPRLRLVTITEADVSNDQSHATIYWTTLPPDVLAADPARTGGDRLVGEDAVATAFESAAGRIQGLLGDRLTSRKTPELHFEVDPVADQAARVEALIRKVRAEEPSEAATGPRHDDMDPDVDRQPDPLDADWDASDEPVDHDRDDPSADTR